MSVEKMKDIMSLMENISEIENGSVETGKVYALRDEDTGKYLGKHRYTVDLAQARIYPTLKSAKIVNTTFRQWTPKSVIVEVTLTAGPIVG